MTARTIVAVPYNVHQGGTVPCCPVEKPCSRHTAPAQHNLVVVTCPDCDGRGFTRQHIGDRDATCQWCDRCDARGTLKVHA